MGTDSPLTVRVAGDRGTTVREGLACHHTFSFGRYRDPDRTRRGPLRVLNEHVIEPGSTCSPPRRLMFISLTKPHCPEQENSMTDWVFEPGHTAAEFVTRHMMGSKVLGHFTNVEVLEGRPCPET